VDQIIHDAALQNLPIVIALDRAGFVGDDGETHQGLFDIALFRPVPNCAILAPASEAELRLMLNWALEDRPQAAAADGDDAAIDLLALAERKTFNGGPVLIRYPKSHCPVEIPAFSLPLELGRGVFVSGPHDDSRVCLAFTGGLYTQAVEAAALLAAQGFKADLYNLRFLKPLDEEYLAELIKRYELTVFIEEGISSGGFGEYAAGLACRQGLDAAVLALAAAEHFAALGTREQLLRFNGLDAHGIAATALRHYRPHVRIL
jgi:1-deoxy-D-xylulose-5-phosphate synthase